MFFHGQTQISHQTNLASDRSQHMPLKYQRKESFFSSNQINKTKPPKFWAASEHVMGIPQAVFSSVASPHPALVILQSFLVFGQRLSCCLDLKPCTEVFCYFRSPGEKSTKQTKTNVPLHCNCGLLRLRRSTGQGISSQVSLPYQRHG